MRTLSAVPALVIALLVLAAAGCGGSGDGTSQADGVSPGEAVAEIEQIKTMLEDAVGQLRSGDADAAEQTVGDAYLEHFEQVEAPLGERDPELKESLEEAISTDLRNEIKAGKSAAEIEAAVEQIDADLDRAVEVLQR